MFNHTSMHAIYTYIHKFKKKNTQFIGIFDLYKLYNHLSVYIYNTWKRNKLETRVYNTFRIILRTRKRKLLSLFFYQLFVKLLIR